jgi:TatD DNase family protein
MLVDSHCHLEYPALATDIEAVMARAHAAGVGLCVSISTKLETFPRVREIAGRFENVWCSVGIHPHEAAAEPLSGAAPLIERAADPKVVGVGETGLDYFYEHSPRAAQAANFRAHIDAARQTGLPLIVHTRDHHHPARGDGERRVQRRAALLHRQPAAGRGGAGPRLLHLRLRYHHLQEVR